MPCFHLSSRGCYFPLYVDLTLLPVNIYIILSVWTRELLTLPVVTGRCYHVLVCTFIYATVQKLASLTGRKKEGVESEIRDLRENLLPLFEQLEALQRSSLSPSVR